MAGTTVSKILMTLAHLFDLANLLTLRFNLYLVTFHKLYQKLALILIILRGKGYHKIEKPLLNKKVTL